MSVSPLVWTEEELMKDVAISTGNFRNGRLSPTQAWEAHCKKAHAKFEALFQELDDLDLKHHLADERLVAAYKGNLGDALRYLAGPPISDDDLKTIAAVDSIVPGVLVEDLEALRKVFGVIERVIDPVRFPWVLANRRPTNEERSAALLASSVLLAAQRVATERRTTGKSGQEGIVKDYLTSFGFEEVPTEDINTIVKGPQQKQFCGECKLGTRKADIVVRLYDTRLMPIECKVSNSAVNSVKRVNNDAAAKAEYWLKQFGASQVVPTAMLSGVFNVLNLVQAQERGLVLFWAHDLVKLGQFISSTK